jgi:hypothetical protein
MHGNAIAKVLEERPVKIVRELPDGVKNWAPPGASMVVSSAREVNELMALPTHGKLITLDPIRDALAVRYGTTIACPVSTAIFINIAAQAAEDWRTMGRADTTAWWRTLKSGGVLNDRYPGGIAAHAAALEREGHMIGTKGRKSVVEGYESALFDL